MNELKKKKKTRLFPYNTTFFKVGVDLIKSGQLWVEIIETTWHRRYNL